MAAELLDTVLSFVIGANRQWATGLQRSMRRSEVAPKSNGALR